MSDANAAEIENVETTGKDAVAETPRSARDDVLAAFKEIESAPAKTGDKSEVAAPDVKAKPGEKTEAAKGTERGPDGKFLPKAGEKVPDAAQVAAQAAQPQPIAPPPNWKGDGKIDWKRLPRPIQEALAVDYQSRAQLEQRFNPLQEILAPREQALVGQYGSVATAVRRLFELSDYAAQDPRGFISQFMQQRGLQFSQPTAQAQPNGAQQGGEQQPIDPRYQALEREVFGLKQVFTQQQQQELQAIQTQATQDVQAFLANADKYPFAQDVRQELIQLFTSGQAKTLEDAYERAILINPATQKRVMADRVQAELDRQAKVAAEKKLASGSVNGAPGSQPIAAGRRAGRSETVRDSVAAAAQEIGFMGAARL